MQKQTSAEQVESQQQLDQLRTLLLGEDHQLISHVIKKHAREVVSEVLTEALHDREKKDGSVNKVILPLVENAVAHSVTHHSDRLISSLYPLMGSLVRKSVAAFLADFMEKTNQLLENSLTIKGLKWRFTAWRAGISFSQFIASQTFIYRVEHVFVIDNETGLLLKSVSLDNNSNNNTDIISSMLSAINDFIGDSFFASPEGLKEQLKTVTTDNFNLLLKPGPKATLVAAVTGNPPQRVSDQLQITIETLHTLYSNELNQFDGDNSLFDNADTLLSDCLIAEEKSENAQHKKFPWLAWFLIAIACIFISLQVNHWYTLKQINSQLNSLKQPPGMIVQHFNVIDSDTIELDVLRDPAAITVQNWLQSHHLSFAHIKINERFYLSLDDTILQTKIAKIIAQYPDVETDWQNNSLSLSGSIDSTKLALLTNQLTGAGFNNGNLNLNNLAITETKNISNTPVMSEHIFQSIVGKIAAIQLDFGVASEKITPPMQQKLSQLYQQFIYLSELADALKKNVGLVILGSSDNSGSIKVNNQLSLQRAENTKNTLNKLGIPKEKMFTTGLGQINIYEVKNTSRKVMFNVIYVDKQ